MPLRGMASAFAGLAFVIGPLVCALIANYTGVKADAWAYREIFVAQFGFGAVSLISCLFMPESPVWLAGRGEDAKVLRTFKVLGCSPTESEGQLALLTTTFREAAAAEKSSSWLDCLRGTNLRRTSSLLDDRHHSRLHLLDIRLWLRNVLFSIGRNSRCRLVQVLDSPECFGAPWKSCRGMSYRPYRPSPDDGLGNACACCHSFIGGNCSIDFKLRAKSTTPWIIRGQSTPWNGVNVALHVVRAEHDDRVST